MKRRRQAKRRQKSTRAATKPKASTKDVLGGIASARPVPRKWRRHYERLVELRRRLLTRTGDLVKDASEGRPVFSQHMADAGTDHYDRDFALSRVSSQQNALYEVQDALDRIRNGTYGICEMTGKPIERERLNALPWTRFSAKTERLLEKEGAVARTRMSAGAAIPRISLPEEVEQDSEEG